MVNLKPKSLIPIKRILLIYLLFSWFHRFYIEVWGGWEFQSLMTEEKRSIFFSTLKIMNGLNLTFLWSIYWLKQAKMHPRNTQHQLGLLVDPTHQFSVLLVSVVRDTVPA